MSKRPIYFILCDKCGNWRYTTKIVKTAKCLTCGKSINFSKAKMEIYNVESLQYAPEILKRIKLRDAKKIDSKITFEYEDQK